MSRLTQIFQNSFIRLEGWFGVIFKSFFSLIRNLFGSFAKVLGLTKSDYFLESDAAEGIKQAANQQTIAKIPDKTPETPVTRSRRQNAKMDDYFLNMARDVKKN
ncbi:MAG TPA: threonine dehydratase [Nodularia sp. (in: cyanobacteria)]|nr:threonine dehydratase [Nodularia sp. (in: cyanobacteria)]